MECRKSLIFTGQAFPLKEQLESSEKQEWFNGGVAGETLGLESFPKMEHIEHLRGMTADIAANKSHSGWLASMVCLSDCPFNT